MNKKQIKLIKNGIIFLLYAISMYLMNTLDLNITPFIKMVFSVILTFAILIAFIGFVVV